MRTIDHNTSIIQLKDICFSYGKEEVLHNVMLEIHRGDYLGIIGPNGGGKTTVLKVMLGLLEPSCGSIHLFGTELRSFKEWSRIGYVPQKVTHFDPNFPATVEEVVLMGRYGKRGLLRKITAEDRNAVREALKKVEMDQVLHRMIGDLSGGQQQRVFIARALVCNPEVIILDEPTAGVDQETQDNFYALLRNLNKKYDLTLVLVTHDAEIVNKEATEIAQVNRTLEYHVNPHYA